MTELNQIYKCEICGNITEVLHTGAGELVCCNQPMKLMKENTVDASQEKHVPVIERQENEITVKVGSIDHPMEDNHYIEWIEIFVGEQKIGRKYLNPGDDPKAEFCTSLAGDGIITARAYCNVHGLWSSK